MLMPTGCEFNGSKDVLQFKLIQAAKERNIIHSNNIDNNYEKVMIKNNDMEMNEEDPKIKRVNKKRHRVELMDMDNNKHSF